MRGIFCNYKLKTLVCVEFLFPVNTITCLSSPGCRRRVTESDPSVVSTEMASVVLEFKSSAGDSEPQNRPVLVIGQLVNLQKVGWNQIKGKLQPGVSKEVPKMPPRSLLANSRPTEINVS